MGCDTTWTVNHDRGMVCKSEHCRSGCADVPDSTTFYKWGGEPIRVIGGEPPPDDAA